ncbi:MAG: bacteriohemerythrin [Fusobacteriaceae bacterium]|nr:bacteriohemerythrin [Fusobacteriaceae bacterium]
MSVRIKMICLNIFNFLVLSVLLNLVFIKYPTQLILGTLISLVITAIISFASRKILLEKSLDKNIRDLKSVLNLSLDGNLKTRIPVDSNNEINGIQVEVNKVLDNLENIVVNIKGVSKKLAENTVDLDKNLNSIVNSSSDESIKSIKESMEQIVQMVTAQTAQTEEIFASLTEITDMINKTSENIDFTRNISKETTELAKIGGAKVSDSLKEMIEIRTTVKNIETKAHNLGESSTKVGQIVKIINGISEQTNLLALNAAIEAARAGEAGKGFAVVADEVRKLAENSKTSTFEISNLVNSIQTEVFQVIEAVNYGYSRVNLGVDLAEEANGNIEKIIEKVEVTEKRMDNITEAIKEQALATNEINSTMESIANNSTEINHISMIHNESLDSVTNFLNNSLKNLKTITIVSEALNNLVQIFDVDETKSVNEIEAMPWKDSYSVNVKSIDEQHKKLVSIINELNNAMLYEKGRSVIGKVLKDLVDYTVSHFDYEEKLMEKNGYSDLENHKKIHKDLLKTVGKFYDEFSSGEVEMSKDIMDFLKTWLSEHILGSDKKYSEIMMKNKQN